MRRQCRKLLEINEYVHVSEKDENDWGSGGNNEWDNTAVCTSE